MFSTVVRPPTRPRRWWQWRRRAERLRFLERVASMEILVTLDQDALLQSTFEQAYLITKYAGGSVHKDGTSWIEVLGIASAGGQCAHIRLRSPMPVDPSLSDLGTGAL